MKKIEYSEYCRNNHIMIVYMYQYGRIKDAVSIDSYWIGDIQQNEKWGLFLHCKNAPKKIDIDAAIKGFQNYRNESKIFLTGVINVYDNYIHYKGNIRGEITNCSKCTNESDSCRKNTKRDIREIINDCDSFVEIR